MPLSKKADGMLLITNNMPDDATHLRREKKKTRLPSCRRDANPLVPLLGSLVRRLGIATELGDWFRENGDGTDCCSPAPATRKARKRPNPDAVAEEIMRESGWLHLDQVAARRQGPHYEHAMRTMPALLRMDQGELTQNLQTEGVPIRESDAAFLMRHPELLPKADLWPGLSKSLLLQEDYFETGGAYQRQYCVRRLMRYHHQGRCLVHTYAPKLDDPSDVADFRLPKLRQILSWVEAGLLKPRSGLIGGVR